MNLANNRQKDIENIISKNKKEIQLSFNPNQKQQSIYIVIKIKSLKCSDISYNPDFWNDGRKYLNGIQLTTNCYAYALNLICNPKSKKKFTIYPFQFQPGNLSGRSITDPTTTVTGIITACKNDAKAINSIFIEAKPGLLPPPGTWKVALVLAPNLCTPYNKDKSDKEKICVDYHWYRQNPDGKTWSHKFGKSEVTNLDCSGKVIVNPELADRNDRPYGGHNFSIFGGYFFVGPGNNDHIQHVSINKTKEENT